MSVRRNAIAYLALFIALGGTSYAATQLSANSVGTRQLKNGAVTNSKVRPHSLGAGAFAPGTIPRPLHTTIVSVPFPYPPCPANGCVGPYRAGLTFTEFVECPPPTVLLSGGFSIPADLHGAEDATQSAPFAGGWQVTLTTTQVQSVAPSPMGTAYAVCAT